MRRIGGKSREECGAHLIELSFVLPVFFLLCFGIIDLARVVAGYSAVRSAVAFGARRATGTARTEWRDITDAFQRADEQHISAGQLSVLRVSPTFVHSADASHLGSWYQRQMAKQGLGELYRLELRGIAYANTALARSVGSAKYPCENEPNCFRCFTLRGDREFQEFFSADGLGQSWIVKVLALRCEFDVPLSAPSMAFGALPKHLTVSSQVYLPVDSYADEVYTP